MSRLAFVLVGAILPISNHTISEYVRGGYWGANGTSSIPDGRPAFVVRSMQLEFLKAARMDDVLEVITTPEQVKGASITLAQQVRRGDDVLVEAKVRVAFVSEGRARPIPKALRLAMKADQAR